MKSNIRIVLFGFLTLVLTIIILQPVVQNSATLSQGKEYRFQMRPVDPVDFFRGRYVTLNFPSTKAPVYFHADTIKTNQTMYGILETGSTGYTTVKYLSVIPPRNHSFIEVNLRRASSTLIRENNQKFTDSEYSFQYPFTRFYMNEKDAPIAEAIYRRETRSDSSDNYLAVKVRNGHAVIKELYLDGEPIKEALKKEKVK